MKLFKIAVAAMALFALTGTASLAADGRYVILFKSGKLSKNLAADIEAAGGTLVRTLPQVGIAIATSPDAQFAKSALRIKGVADAGLVGAWTLPEDNAPEQVVTMPEAPTAADVYFNNGWLWNIDRVHAPDAWANGHTGSHDTVVAVIDTGVAWTHPDLAPNVVWVDCITSVSPCNPYPGLSNHGTHVAGTVAAAFGGAAIVGVGPDLGIAGYNVFENIPGCGVCAYSDSRWAAMIDAAERGFEVLSMSLGGYAVMGGQGSNGTAAYLQAEKKVANYVRAQGSLMVASAGNEAVNLSGRIFHVPGDIPQMVNVSATGIQPIPRYPAADSHDILAFYSNYGGAVDIAGPGGDCGEVDGCSGSDVNGYWYGEFFVWSTINFPNPTCAATYSCSLGYGGKAGTSMATPHVSAVAALIFDANPGITPNEVAEHLKDTAQNIGSGKYFGAGMVRADWATD